MAEEGAVQGSVWSWLHGDLGYYKLEDQSIEHCYYASIFVLEEAESMSDIQGSFWVTEDQ